MADKHLKVGGQQWRYHLTCKDKMALYFSSSHHQTGPVQEPRDKSWTSVRAVGGIPPLGGLWELSMLQGKLFVLPSS